MLPSYSVFSTAILLIPIARVSLGHLVARARVLGLLDRPGGRHLHPRPMAVVGGLAVISSWAIGLAAIALFYPAWAGAHALSLGVGLAGTAAILGLGLADDRNGVSPLVRLGVELAVAGATVFFEPGVHRFCAELVGEWGPSIYALTAIGIVAVMNAMNLVDGLDGLAASVFASIALAISALTGVGSATPGFAAVSTLMLLPGLCVFLRLNWSPARVFMGDHGSLAVGYVLATSALSVQVDAGGGHTSRDLVALAILFSYPMLDMLICMVRRLRARQPVFVGDRNHMHHRMLRLGLATGESAASLIAWQLAMLSPVALVGSLPARFAPLLLIPSCAAALERLLLIERIEIARLRTGSHIPRRPVLAPAQFALESARRYEDRGIGAEALEAGPEAMPPRASARPYAVDRA